MKERRLYLTLMLLFFSVLVWGCAQEERFIELSPLEMKKFINEDGNGFVMLTSDEDERDVWINIVKEIAKDQKVTVRELDENRSDIDGSSNPGDWELTQRRDTLAYYQDGELKKDIKFKDHKFSDLEVELEEFVKNIKSTYEYEAN